MLAAVLACLLVAGMLNSPQAQAAGVPDTLEQRLASCAICHGKNGEGLKAGEYYPRIAGKPAGYLYNQLVNFRDRRRKSPAMNYAVAFLSDDYLREIAAHYSKLAPAPLRPVPAPASEVLARGRRLAMQGDPARKIPPCTACHGQALTGMEPAIPGLVGLEPAYIAAQMGAWRNKLRHAQAPDCMAQVAAALAPEDMPAIAAWLATRPLTGSHAPLGAGTLHLPLKCGVEMPAAASPATKPADEAQARGEYLVQAGDCLSCHTAYGGQPFAGGRAIPTPFGTLYGPNITPDPETGIGKWSAEDFWRALHDGIRRDGALLYPAFPYPNYTKVRREDADAMYGYLMSQPRVRQRNRPHDMRFPYDKRALLTGWRALYFKEGVHQDDPAQSAQWNRGAYLVEGLGHCNACHAERSVLGGVKPQQATAGGLIPVLNWYAPSLTSGRETGLGDWEAGEVVDLLKHGVSPRAAVFGPMSEVVRNSLQHLTEADLAAMAAYLKSQKKPAEASGGTQVQVTAAQAGEMMTRGARLYKDRCSECHQPGGEGVARIYPPLAGTEAILMRNPVNAVRMVLNGGFAPSTGGNPRPYGMPPFGQVLDDDDVASLVTYIRGSWGNAAAPVSPVDVARTRDVPLD